MYEKKFEQPTTPLVDQITPFDRFLEATAISGLIYIWAFTIYIFQTLPDKIPIRFDAMGAPEGWGPKATIFGLPCVAAFTYTLLSVIPKLTKKFNYPFKINPQNETIQYQYALRLFRVIKVIVLLTCIAVVHAIYHAITSVEPTQNVWLLPSILFLVFAPIGIYLFHAWKAR